MSKKNKDIGLLPYELIEAAVSGDADALARVLEHYRILITKESMVYISNAHGATVRHLSRDIRDEVEIHLMKAICSFKL